MSTFIARQAAAWTQIRQQFEGHNETVNGPGSTLDATAEIRHQLPRIITDYSISSILDAPCGDWNWMRHVDLAGVDYTGLDVEPTLIDANRTRFPQHRFDNVNLLGTYSIPAYDLIICRDFTLHLPNPQIKHVLALFRESGSEYLLTSNWPGTDNTRECDPDGGQDDRAGYYCHQLDLETEPFNLRGRVESFTESEGQEMVVFDLGESR